MGTCATPLILTTAAMPEVASHVATSEGGAAFGRPTRPHLTYIATSLLATPLILISTAAVPDAAVTDGISTFT